MSDRRNSFPIYCWSLPDNQLEFAELVALSGTVWYWTRSNSDFREPGYQW